MTESEKIIAQINSNIFFKEFTFSKNDFKDLDGKQQLQFSDNVVWLDDILFIYEIKERSSEISNEKKWFDNKILKQAVKQIKATVGYLQNYPKIIIENEKGHKLDIKTVKNYKIAKKIIIYSTNLDFAEDLRNKKFYESAEVGLIHLFHVEDYFWICEYLKTPCEVNDYLRFRESFFHFDNRLSNGLPEQYFLSHFFETPNADHFNPTYIENLINYKDDFESFDINVFIENFTKNLNNQTEYYPIIAEIAKLNRSELKEFKRRLLLSIENSEKNEFVIPYTIYLPRTDCAIIFIPLHSLNSNKWKVALDNFMIAHKYESKAKKCIGVVIFRDPNDLEYLEIYWQFIEYGWEVDEELASKIKATYPPLRKTITIVENNPYKGEI